MKKYRRSRDDGRFALTTLQNPNLEVRSLPQLIAAAQNLVAEQEAAWKAGRTAADVPLSADAPPPAEEQATPADDAPAEAPPIVAESLATDATPRQSPAPAPETSPIPAAPPAPQPRPPRKTLVRQSPRSSRKKAAKGQPRPRAPRRELTALERHERKCVICANPYRDTIESYFLHWYPPHRIAEEFDIPEVRYIYRHAHATGLMQHRRKTMRDSLEYIVERACDVVPTADAVIRAVQACSRINAQGEWVDPPKQVIFSSDVQRHVSPEGQRRASSDVQRRSANGPAPLELPENLPKLPPAIDVQPAISNRHTPRLENVVCHSKQTTAPVSNRHFFTGLARKIRAFRDA